MPPGLRLSDVKKHLAKVATNRRPESPIDIYVSSSTGHQIREADAATEGGWQAGRTSKLKSQFSVNGPVAGVKRKANEVVRESKRLASSSAVNNSNATLDSYFVTNEDPTQTTQTHAASTDTVPKPIFESCTIFVNGTTGAAGVSDIELKKILSSHGAVVSYYLARRQITHVILTDPAATAPALLLESQRPMTPTSTPSSSSSSSPSPSVVSSGPTVLAGRKVELEMKARNPTKIHYVSVEWVLESVKQGKRLAETKFPAAPLRLAKQVTLMNCKKVKPHQQSLKDMVPGR